MSYTGNTLSDLDSSTPVGTETVSSLDDAIRQVKRFLKDPTGLLATVYPVGHIYVSTTDDDPATTLGFGTWLKLEEVVLVGHKEFSDEFGTVTANKSTNDGGVKKEASVEDPYVPANNNLVPYRVVYMFERTA